MALVTSNQFRQTPDVIGSLSRGSQFGKQVRQSQLQPQIETLRQQAIGGDQSALQKLASISPQDAQQVQQFKSNEEAATQRPGQLELSKLKASQGESEARLKSVIEGAVQARNLPTDERRLNFLKQRKLQLESQGIQTQDTDEVIALFEAGQADEANALIDSAIKTGRDLNLIDGTGSAEQKSFENLIADFSDEDKAKAKRIKAGLSPRMVGSATQTIAKLGTQASIADVESVIAGAKEVGKLKGQKTLKPEVEAAVISAVGQAKAEVKKLAENRSNSKTLGIYETAMGNLTKALDDTITGPFIGFTPALTSNAQIADGAVSMMLPLMKDLFRGAGEGTFTEGDQKILTNLIPTRNDTAEARASKITMIDAMIRAKLSAPSAGEGDLSAAELTELEQLRAELGQQ